MKWIFALNAESVDSYGDFARVAVVSALRHTSLEAVCLFDGGEGDFTRWLRAHGVQVVLARSRFHAQLKAIAQKRSAPWILQSGGGAFLRLEVPRLARELGWKDEFAFYTDCDVIFQSDPCSRLEAVRPRWFAACSESSLKRMLDLNTGAMWMNLKTLDGAAGFEAWTRAHLERCVDISFDQAAFRVWFNPIHRLAWRLGIADRRFYPVMARLPIRTWQWDKLPLELNWKPYWGANPGAAIIHFHGLKPTQRGELAAGTLPGFIARMHTPFFDECAAKWDGWLEVARAT